MKSTVIKRSVVVSRHRTSISLEDAFWHDLRDIARAQGSTISESIEEIEGGAASTAIYPRRYAFSYLSTSARSQIFTPLTVNPRQATAP